ncbi:MAG: FAD-dependent monooxygenase [Gammaproteobacteria bacterium]|jgi:2-polyprenyl-6-methoxyphenol hydroxylase-like FAD-dependent oxidoreductase
MHNIIVNDYSKHIAIIGAGISGLALGCILKKANIPVVIFEKSNDISDYGAGISISPNGIKVLKYLNIYDEVIAFSMNPKEAVYFSGNKKINNFNVDVITTSRQTLYKVLYNNYKQLDGEILFDHQLNDINTDRLKINFIGNKLYKVNHIVACDGVKSLCRKKIDSDKDPLYSGYSVWRAIVEKKQENIKTYLGANHHIVSYPITNSKVSFVAAVKTNGIYQESWRTAGTYAELRNDLANSNPEFLSFINEKTPLFKWGVYIRPPVKNLVYKNLTLLGDAAHPIVPFIGQGGCLALEDAYVFGNLLIKYHSDIHKAQNLYESLRLERIKKISNLSLRQGFLNHLSNPLMVFLRNFVMKFFPYFAMRSIKSNVWNYDSRHYIDNYE